MNRTPANMPASALPIVLVVRPRGRDGIRSPGTAPASPRDFASTLNRGTSVRQIVRSHKPDDDRPKPSRLAQLQLPIQRSLRPGNNHPLAPKQASQPQAPRDAMNMPTQSDSNAPPVPSAATVLDVQALQHLRDLDPQGGNKLLERVVLAFEKSLERLLPELRQARAAGMDLAVVRHVSHTLKSSTASLGALTLSRRCAEIEMLARNGQAEGLDQLLDAMHDELARVRAALAELLPPSP